MVKFIHLSFILRVNDQHLPQQPRARNRIHRHRLISFHRINRSLVRISLKRRRLLDLFSRDFLLSSGPSTYPASWVDDTREFKNALDAFELLIGDRYPEPPPPLISDTSSTSIASTAWVIQLHPLATNWYNLAVSCRNVLPQYKSHTATEYSIPRVPPNAMPLDQATLNAIQAAVENSLQSALCLTSLPSAMYCSMPMNSNAPLHTVSNSDQGFRASELGFFWPDLPDVQDRDVVFFVGCILPPTFALGCHNALKVLLRIGTPRHCRIWRRNCFASPLT